MKKIIISLSICLAAFGANAADTLRVSSLAAPASISYTPQGLQLMMEGSELQNFEIIIDAGKESLSQIDKQKLLDALAMDARQLSEAIGTDTNQLRSAIVTKAKLASTLIIINNAQNPAIEPGGMPVTESAENEGLGWKLWAILGGILLLVVAGVGYFMKKNKKENLKTNPNEKQSINDKEMAKSISTDKTVKIGDLRATIKQLEGQLKDANAALVDSQEQLKTAKAQNKDLSTNLQSWAQQLKAALTRYINPLHAALEQGDKSTAIGKALQAAMQLGSMAKIANKTSEGYDGANAQYLLQGQEAVGNFSTIDAATPQDKIPKNVKTLVEILKENGAGWDGTIVKDYKIGKL